MTIAPSTLIIVRAALKGDAAVPQTTRERVMNILKDKRSPRRMRVKAAADALGICTKTFWRRRAAGTLGLAVTFANSRAAYVNEEELWKCVKGGGHEQVD